MKLFFKIKFLAQLCTIIPASLEQYIELVLTKYTNWIQRMVLRCPFTNDVICSFFNIIIGWLDIHYQNRFKCNIQQNTYWHITKHSDNMNIWCFPEHDILNGALFFNHKWCMCYNNGVWFSEIWTNWQIKHCLDFRQGKTLL